MYTRIVKCLERNGHKVSWSAEGLVVSSPRVQTVLPFSGKYILKRTSRYMGIYDTYKDVVNDLDEVESYIKEWFYYASTLTLTNSITLILKSSQER